MKKSKTKKSILVIVHDAGGAEIIGAYIRKYKHQIDFRSYVAGPARAIFQREKIPFSDIENNRTAIANTIKKNANIKYAIVGTIWHTHIELIALQEAKRAGLHTVAYLDSWTNYRERFGYPKKGWQMNLPDEIWVGDVEAQRLAKKIFPTSLQIRLIPNQYFIRIQKRYKILRQKIKYHCILFLSNSTNDPASALSWLAEITASMQNKPIIRVRFHPSDRRKWFPAIVAKYGRRIKISEEQDLAHDFAKSQIVIGMETTALVAALLCGLPTICIKSKGKKTILPFQRIHTATNMVELKKQLRNLLFMHQKIL